MARGPASYGAVYLPLGCNASIAAQHFEDTQDTATGLMAMLGAASSRHPPNPTAAGGGAHVAAARRGGGPAGGSRGGGGAVGRAAGPAARVPRQRCSCAGKLDGLWAATGCTPLHDVQGRTMRCAPAARLTVPALAATPTSQPCSCIASRATRWWCKRRRGWHRWAGGRASSCASAGDCLPAQTGPMCPFLLHIAYTSQQMLPCL